MSNPPDEIFPLTVQLIDICVHIGPDSIANLPVAHRVAYPGGTTPLAPDVDVHSPTLEGIDTDPPIQVTLSGATVSFSDALGGGFTGFPLPPCVPHLVNFYSWMEQLSPGAVLNMELGNGENLGAYIDFNFGQVSIMTPPTISVATQVVMVYPTNTATITITPWPNSTVPAQTFDVILPATVTISSHAPSHKDVDFLITFQTAESTPVIEQELAGQLDGMIGFLKENRCVRLITTEEDSIGCSNSQFP